MPNALFISPHLDDAVFSCGGMVARLSGLGWRVVIATVFTASIPEARGFALACQTDKGIPESVDYMALRRKEDEIACGDLGAEAIHLAHPEAPHRGYESAPELFSEAREEDDIQWRVLRDLEVLVQVLSPDLIFAPQGLGNHVDHLKVIEALEGAKGGLPGLGNRLLHYRDTPYAIRKPGTKPELPDVSALVELGVEIGRSLPEKLRACQAYASQLGFQFGGSGAMRRQLEEFACSEGRRLGDAGLVEAYFGKSAAAKSLEEAIEGSAPSNIATKIDPSLHGEGFVGPSSVAHKKNETES